MLKTTVLMSSRYSTVGIEWCKLKHGSRSQGTYLEVNYSHHPIT